jgi:hypothetical protein
MARAQITLEYEVHWRARRRASDLGVSFSEYVRRLVARDLEQLGPKSDPTSVFDLDRSGASDIATEKDAMIAQAFK